MARPTTPLLSRDRIADAAMELIESGKPFGVNALGRRLKVNPSSLYHHVSGQEEILELVRGRLAEKYPLAIEAGDWLDLVDHAVRMQRKMYSEHTLAIPLAMSTVITDPTTIQWYDLLATALAERGVPDDRLLDLIAIIDAFSIGFGLDLASPENIWQPQGPTKTLDRAIQAAPSGKARSDQAFEAGLAALIDGLRSSFLE